jgi:hypothetical protein
LSDKHETNEEYQLLARASGFLEAARIVADAEGGRTSLVAPIAHLVAHGSEVLIKHWLLRKGISAKYLRVTYGHNLRELWNEPKNEALRNAANEEGVRALAAAKASCLYRDEEWPDPYALLEEYISQLSRLHTNETGYALRYAAEPDTKVPIPLFLLDVFQPLKDRLARAYSRQDYDI